MSNQVELHFELVIETFLLSPSSFRKNCSIREAYACQRKLGVARRVRGHVKVNGSRELAAAKATGVRGSRMPTSTRESSRYRTQWSREKGSNEDGAPRFIHTGMWRLKLDVPEEGLVE
jgi:hypothetical protein